MGLRINTNVASLNAQRSLRGTRLDMGRNYERMSSGYRINRAGDDAAGLAISENLKAQIRGYSVNVRNAEDGISLVQVAEGALQETSNILTRLRELGVQSSSDTIGDSERGFLDLEYQQLISEIDRIAKGTEFNATKLLLGEDKPIDVQIGIRNNQGIDRITFNGKDANATVEGLGLKGLNVYDKKTAQESLAILDKTIQRVSGIRAQFGAFQNRLESTIGTLGASIENLSAANSRIRDADMARETAELARTNIMLNAGTAVLKQANQSTGVALQLLS